MEKQAIIKITKSNGTVEKWLYEAREEKDKSTKVYSYFHTFKKQESKVEVEFNSNIEFINQNKDNKWEFESYQDKEGKQCAKYKVRVRSQQYALFGKNKEAEEARKEIIETVKEIVQEAKPAQSPKSVNWQSSPVVPENDDVPF